MEKPKILIELYGGLLNRVVSTCDADVYVLTEYSTEKTFEELGQWEHLILVKNEKEFERITKKIISR
jgi:hypothetical protein